jgi:hypothetical protein
MIYNTKVAINEVLTLAFKDKQKVKEWWKIPADQFGGKTPAFMWKSSSLGRYKVSMYVLKLLEIHDTIQSS